MTFPTVESVALSATTSAVTNHSVTLPGGIQSGDLLVAVWANRFSTEPVFPAGWTVVFSRVDGAGTPAHWNGIATRVADGTEGASITVTTSANRNSARHVYRITGHDSFTSPGDGFNGALSTPPFPELDHEGGSVDTLWLATLAFITDLNSFSAGYTAVDNKSTSGSNDVTLASGYLEKTGSVEQPGDASIGSSRFTSQTSAVLPASAQGIERTVGSVLSGSLVDSV